MGDKQKTAARAPAAKRGTGKRKAKKTTSTLKRASNRRKKATTPDSDDGEFIDGDGTADISIGDILMELPARDQGAHASAAGDEDIESSDDDEVDEDFAKKVKKIVPAAFDICFEVPYKNATRDIVIPSNTKFGVFLMRIAHRMDVGVTHLSQIGYVLPWNKPKSGKPIPKLLEDEESYSLLISNIRQHIDEQKAKNKGKGVVKPFSVAIIDTSDIGDDKGNSKKKAALQPVAAAPEIDEQDQQRKLITLIEEKHKCEEHGKACYVQSNGAHYQYTMEDFTIWASLLDRRLATIDAPPDRLNLAEKCSRQAVIKRRAGTAVLPIDVPATGGSMNEAMPQWAQMLAAMMGGIGVVARTNYNPYFPQPLHHADPSRSPSQSPPLAPRQLHKRLSSFDDIDLEYPELKPWLDTIEKDPSRNKYNENFSQFVASLVDTHKLFTLEDVASISAQDIATYGQMEFGTASRILRFAKEDVNGLKTRRKKVRL